MNADEVEAALGDAELMACVQAPLGEAKRLRDACLAAGIPVLLDRGGCCGQGGSSCGCPPKMDLLARTEDVARVGRLLHEQWRELALREGTMTSEHPSAAPPPGATELAATPLAANDDPPCPACGTAAPLAAGACSDCGLQLE